MSSKPRTFTLDKIKIKYWWSFTHRKPTAESHPQKVRIASNEDNTKRFFCPFKTLRKYVGIRGGYETEDEQFFVFSDKSPVSPTIIRTLLRKLIARVNLDPGLYDMQSFCIGMASDMLKNGHTIEQIKLAGRWKSNAVYKYLRK